MSVILEDVISSFPSELRIKVITVTATVYLESCFPPDIPLEVIFHMIPIVRTGMTGPVRTKSYKLPWPGEAGLFLSCRHGSSVRGVVIKTEGGKRDNTIFAYVSTSHKNVNVSINRNNLNITGNKSNQDAIEATECTLETLNFMNTGCALVQEYPILTSVLINQVWSQCSPDGLKYDPDILNDQIAPLYEDNDIASAILLWIYLLTQDYLDLKSAQIKVNWALELGPFLTQPLSMSSCQISLAKIDFRMPQVSLEKLKEAFKEAGGYCITYQPMILPYLKIEKSFSSEKKKGSTRHTVNINPDGRINLSCTRVEDLEELISSVVSIYTECLT